MALHCNSKCVSRRSLLLGFNVKLPWSTQGNEHKVWRIGYHPLPLRSVPHPHPIRIWILWNASVKHFVPMWFRADSVQSQPPLVSVAALYCFLNDHCGVSYCIEWRGINNFCAECTTVHAGVSYRFVIIGEISYLYTAYIKLIIT